jgi:hypothetical protein
MKRRTQARRGARPAKAVRGKGKRRRRKRDQGPPNRRRKLTRRGRAQRNVGRPQTAKQFFAMSKQAQDEWTRATHVISKMRADGISLRRAAGAFGLNPDVVLRLAGPALRKRTNGRYAAKASDKLLRILVLPKRGAGLREFATRDSREASKAAEYWNALHRYLSTGDASAIRQFNGKHITDANGSKIRLLTDLKELDRQGNAGNLSFESIYPR